RSQRRSSSLPLLPSSGNAAGFICQPSATTELYTLSLHDALPICFGHGRRIPLKRYRGQSRKRQHKADFGMKAKILERVTGVAGIDRKSTRLNSSHVKISYAVFCLEKKSKLARMAVERECGRMEWA